MQIPADIILAAQKAMQNWKIPASISIAQWALESGWGKHMPPGSNNPFGIKARIRNGALIDPHVVAVTNENYVPGTTWRGPQPFRKFASIAEAFDYHAKLLATADPYAKARKTLPNAYNFARALTGIYATDPSYGDSLCAIIHSSNLLQYDKVAA